MQRPSGSNHRAPRCVLPRHVNDGFVGGVVKLHYVRWASRMGRGGLWWGVWVLPDAETHGGSLSNPRSGPGPGVGRIHRLLHDRRGQHGALGTAPPR